MPAPNAPKGTKPRSARDAQRGDQRDIPANKQGQKASTPGDTPKSGKKKKSAFDIEALNPPFDPRMRRIGSPLNLTSQIKRGWVQSKDGSQRVNFLFNPSSLDLSHAVDPNVPSPEQTAQSPDQGGATPFLASTTSSTGVTLLYDRTYELFSAPRSGKLGFANEYGVWADVAAWYTYMGMLPAMPTSWEDSLITGPPTQKESYLFVGTKMVYYGWITNINVTYSHWTQAMVPTRCAVNLSFMILPHIGSLPLPGQGPIQIGGDTWVNDWLGGLQLNPDGTLTGDGTTE